MKDLFENNLRLPIERWKHIITRHPEVKSKQVQQALLKPDIIVVSANNPEV